MSQIPLQLSRHHFRSFVAKTSYDLYKYKLKEAPVSYSKRKVYRYQVGSTVYDLVTENHFKYLLQLLISKENFEQFKETDLWIRTLVDLNLYSFVVKHIEALVETCGFYEIKLPEDLSINATNPKEPKLKLTVDWFRDKNKIPEKDEVYLVIFHN